MAEIAATRSAALALIDERALMRQGYEFLDEKRMLLAAEMLRRLSQHEDLSAQLMQAMRAAQAALRQTLLRHGLEGLQACPPMTPSPAAPRTERSLFLGVPLLIATLGPLAGADPPAVDASPEARCCRAAFVAALPLLLQLAAISNNLERLAAEYRRTERRARALENVLLPEIDGSLATIEGQLELADQEEALRIRMAGRRR